MKNKITLSYILTTFNKLNFLKVTLPLLIAVCKEDEEIVVVDGGSTDGTSNYLNDLFEQNKIHKFLSEKDFGEAHGTNKALLMAEGELIKLITDDDIYHFPAIMACREFMLNNAQIDILGFDGFEYNANQKHQAYIKSDCIEGFKIWKREHTPFHFCGLSYLFRKSSLAYLGLFNPDFKIIDLEYSVRVSTLRANIAFYTGPGYVNIVTPQSNSYKFYKLFDYEKRRLIKMYPNAKAVLQTRSLKLKAKEFISKNILKRRISSPKDFNYTKIAGDGARLLSDIHINTFFEII